MVRGIITGSDHTQAVDVGDSPIVQSGKSIGYLSDWTR